MMMMNSSGGDFSGDSPGMIPAGPGRPTDPEVPGGDVSEPSESSTSGRMSRCDTGCSALGSGGGGGPAENPSGDGGADADFGNERRRLRRKLYVRRCARAMAAFAALAALSAVVGYLLALAAEDGGVSVVEDPEGFDPQGGRMLLRDPRGERLSARERRIRQNNRARYERLRARGERLRAWGPGDKRNRKARMDRLRRARARGGY